VIWLTRQNIEPEAYGRIMIDRILSFARDHMVADARDWWRWWSLRFMALAALVQAVSLSSPDALLVAWQNLPPDLRAMLPARIADVVPLLLTIAAIIARHVRQPATPDQHA
jgi:hypothetical protein